MGDKDKSATAIAPDPAQPTPEQVKQFEEWWRAQNALGPTDPFHRDPRLALALQQLQQQKAAQQTPTAPRSVVFVDPSSGGNSGGPHLPFPSSEAPPAKPGWGERVVNKLPGDGWFSEAVRYGFPLAKEGLAETGKMVALPFAWMGKVMAHPLDPVQGLDEAQKLKYRWFPNAPKTWSESGHQASEMVLRPLRELAGERQPNVSVMEEEELSKIGPGFAASQQPWPRRLGMAMSAFMGGNPDAARRHAANAYVAHSQGDETTASRETGRAVAEWTAKPVATSWFPDAKDLPGFVKDLRDLRGEMKGVPHVPAAEPRVAPRVPEPSAPRPSAPAPKEPVAPLPSAERAPQRTSPPRSEPAKPAAAPQAKGETPKSVPKEQATSRPKSEPQAAKASAVKQAKGEAPKSTAKEPAAPRPGAKQPSAKTPPEKAAAVSQIQKAKKAGAPREGAASPGRRAVKPEASAASTGQAKASAVKRAQQKKKQ